MRKQAAVILGVIVVPVVAFHRMLVRETVNVFFRDDCDILLLAGGWARLSRGADCIPLEQFPISRDTGYLRCAFMLLMCRPALVECGHAHGEAYTRGCNQDSVASVS